MKFAGASQCLAGAVERQDPAVVGQRMQNDGDVLARLHHFVEVADAAVAHRAGQRPVHPLRLAAAQEIAAGQVGGRQVVVAGDGRSAGTPSRAAIWATKRVLPLPVGPFSSSGRR